MAEFQQLPAELNISCVAGDDLRLTVKILSGRDCETASVDISGLLFEAFFTGLNTNYPAEVTKDIANSRAILTWTDSQTATAGPGEYQWKLRITDGEITRTRLSGRFRVHA